MVVAALLALSIASAGQSDTWDRGRLIDALTTLTLTGEPRHIDHDAGQQLWIALQPKLGKQRDRELRWLATRAAVPVVVTILRPITPVGEAPTLEIRAQRVLPLPWRTSVSAAIDVQVDAREWRHIWTIRDGNREYVQLENVLTRDELAAGFHVLHLRARIHYDRAPAGMPQASVVNVGSATAYGVTIDVLAGSTLTDKPFHQVTVRDIGAGERVDLSYEIPFPAEYGWVEVWAMILSDHAAASIDAIDPADSIAIALLNRDGMPSPLPALVCRSVLSAGQCRD